MEGSYVKIQMAEIGYMMVCNPSVDYRVAFSEDGLIVGVKVQNG